MNLTPVTTCMRLFFPTLPRCSWSRNHSWIADEKAGFISGHFDVRFKGRASSCQNKRHTEHVMVFWSRLDSLWFCLLIKKQPGRDKGQSLSQLHSNCDSVQQCNHRMCSDFTAQYQLTELFLLALKERLHELSQKQFHIQTISNTQDVPRKLQGFNLETWTDPRGAEGEQIKLSISEQLPEH